MCSSGTETSTGTLPRSRALTRYTMKARFLYLILIMTLLLSSCVATTRPDLRRLYEQQSGRKFFNPVIVIHGYMGSRLRDRESLTRLWPPGLFEILRRQTYALALPIDASTLEARPSRIEAYAMFDQLGGIDYYRRLLNTLSRPGGYRFSRPGTPANTGERRYYTFIYDWREDIVVSVRKLDRFISRIRQDYNDPNLKVDIIAHSLGGLITRYYARFGTRDVLTSDKFPITGYGSSRIRKAVLMGTPNLGSVTSVYTYMTGFSVGAYGLPTEILTTMPSIYQLFPHPAIPWLVDINGKQIHEDLYDVATWKKHRWGIFNPDVMQRVIAAAPNPDQGKKRLALLQDYFSHQLVRSERLAWALSIKSDHLPLEYIVFGGDCELTPARLLLEKAGGQERVRIDPDQLISPHLGVDYSRFMMQPGDGRVTKPSLLSRESLDPTLVRSNNIFLPLDYSIMFCEVHKRLTGNVHFQDNLLNILLTAD